MGATYELSGRVALDLSREAEYLPLLEKLTEELLPEEYSYDPISGELWIDSWALRSHASMERIDDALTKLGRYAVQAARLDTRYDGGDVEPFWIGPDELALIRAKITEARHDIAWAMNDLARLMWEEELWLLQQSVG